MNALNYHRVFEVITLTMYTQRSIYRQKEGINNNNKDLHIQIYYASKGNLNTLNNVIWSRTLVLKSQCTYFYCN